MPPGVAAAMARMNGKCQMTSPIPCLVCITTVDATCLRLMMFGKPAYFTRAAVRRQPRTGARPDRRWGQFHLGGSCSGVIARRRSRTPRLFGDVSRNLEHPPGTASAGSPEPFRHALCAKRPTRERPTRERARCTNRRRSKGAQLPRPRCHASHASESSLARSRAGNRAANPPASSSRRWLPRRTPVPIRLQQCACEFAP